MYVTFEHEDRIAHETRALIQRRVRCATRELAIALTGVRVHLSSSIKFPFVHEKRCWVELTLSDSSVVIGAAQTFGWRSAIDLAMARASRGLPKIGGAKQLLRAPLAGSSPRRR